jgi:DNA-binding transcriptional LysR family regulator
MARENLNDLAAFVAVARERSFTNAAAKLRVSTSALSHTLRGLEERLGLRLLTRTTRSVSPTHAGERLLRSIGPCLDEIDAELTSLSDLRERPSGSLRITCGEHPAQTILWPALKKLVPNYPDIHVEVIVDYGLTDIVAERYDAGVRLGEQVASRCRSGRRCAWLSLPRLRILADMSRPRDHRTSHSTTASTFACRRVAASSSGTSKSAGTR